MKRRDRILKAVDEWYSAMYRITDVRLSAQQRERLANLIDTRLGAESR